MGIRQTAQGVGVTSPTTWQGIDIAQLNRALRPLMSGVGSRETGLDSLFASKPGSSPA